MCQQPNFSIAKCCNSAINGKAISGAFNQERTPVGAFSVIVKTRWTIVSSSSGDGGRVMATYQGIAAALRLVIKTSRKLAVPQFPSHQHQQQPSSSSQRWGIGVTLGPSLSSSTIYSGSAHFTPIADNFAHLPFFALFLKTQQFSPEIITHQPITI